MSKSSEMFLAMQEAEAMKSQTNLKGEPVTYKKLTPTQEKLLLEPLPNEALKPHPTKTFLTVINPMYVVERLNNVFGIGNWQIRSRVINQETSHIVVQSLLSIPEYDIAVEAFGGNKNDDLGDSYKGAQTDALTKAASYLGIGIDIYKGIGPKPKTTEQNSDKTDDRAWLNENTAAFKKAKEYVTGGGDVEKIAKKYKLSKKVYALLLNKEPA